MFRLEQETAEDEWEIEYLLDLAFAPGRKALSSYRLREGVEPVRDLCLVARDDLGVLAGAVRFWPIVIGEKRAPALLLGPIAVHPTRQGEGLGGLLIEESLDKARSQNWNLVILIGDEPYYRRFGFEKAILKSITFPEPTNPDRILLRELVPGAAQGVEGLVKSQLG